MLKLIESKQPVIATSDEVYEKPLEPYVVSSCDELGNLVCRRNALTGAAKDYTWDTWGRLVHVVDHSSDGNQTNAWAYKYDALGRRLETAYQGERSVVTKSYYDPEFEYLELGLGINDTTIWKQYGPDSSGYYGELNGIGGLEGIIHGKTGDSMGAISSVVGDVAAYTYQGEAYFLEGSVDSYGRLTGDRWLEEESEELTDNTVFWVLKNSRFRGRRVEGNGLSNFGARYYNVATASFLSPDPYGHNGSLDLYSYASADPVNYVDPDGRLSQPVNEPIGARTPSAQQAATPKASFYSRASTFVASKLDYIQTSLDVVGMTPIYGNIADVANAAISGARGNWGEMSLNMAAAVPGIGIGVTTGKLAARAGGEVAGHLTAATKTADHHIFPQQFKKYFESKGISIDSFTVTVGHQNTHLKGIHGSGNMGQMPGGWNKVWKQWIEKNSGASTKDVYQQAGKMMGEYKINHIDIHPYKK